MECRRKNALQAPVLFDHAFDIGAAQAANQRGIDVPGVPIRDMLEGKRSFLGHAIHRIPIRTRKPQDSAYDFTGLQIVGHVAELLELCGGAIEVHIEGFSGTMGEIAGGCFFVELCHGIAFLRADLGRELRVYEAAGVSIDIAPGADGTAAMPEANLRSIAVRR